METIDNSQAHVQETPIQWPGLGRMALVATSHSERRTRVTSLLYELGCAVTAVDEGVALLDTLADAILNDEEDGSRPSIIVADALLAGCTGLSVLSGLRELHWQTPIIILADQLQEELWACAWRTGATAIFADPIDFSSLQELAGLVLDPHSGARTMRAFELARSGCPHRNPPRQERPAPPRTPPTPTPRPTPHLQLQPRPELPRLAAPRAAGTGQIDLSRLLIH